MAIDVFMALEMYVPDTEEQKLTLAEGLWTPNFQFAGDRFSSSESARVPTESPAAASGLTRETVDPLVNTSGRPAILRSISTNWVPLTGGYINSAFNFWYLHKGKRVQLSPTAMKFPMLDNAISSRLGSLEDQVGPFVWRPAVPIRVKVDQSIYLACGAAANENTFTFKAVDAGAASEVSHCIFARSLDGRREYQFAAAASTASSVTTHINRTEEEIEIYAISILCPEDASYRALFDLRIGQRRFMRTERPFWMFADPFAYGRLDLSYLPEGGLVLYPSDKVALDLKLIQSLSD